MALPNFITSLFGAKKVEETGVKSGDKVIYITLESGGSSGTENYAGYDGEEYLATLRGPERAKEFDKMERSDAQITMLLSAVKNPIRGAGREIQPAGDKPEHLAHAALVEQVLLKDIDIEQTIDNCLTVCKYGHAVLEKTHKIFPDKPILDKEEKPVLGSYIGLKKLGFISPKTIQTWNFNKETKELETVWQLAYGDLAVSYYHPVRHLMIISLNKEGDNYEGVALIRPCYGNYFRKKNYYRQNAAAIEKSMPLPTAEIPSGKETTQEYTNLIKVLKAFTSHQQNYLTFPAGWNVQLNNGTQYDPSKIETSIDKEDIRMAKAFLANFLELGLSGAGAFALSNDLSDFFLSSELYLAAKIEKAFNLLIEELVQLNFGPQVAYPTFKFTGIADKAGKELAEILGIMATNKILTPDDALEDHMRKRLGISDRSDIGVRVVEPAQQTYAPKTLSEKIRAILQHKEK